MAIEREHKYLVKDRSFEAMSHKSLAICQGYLSRERGHTVRVRTVDDRGFLTVKGKTVEDSRLEFEYEIPLADAEQLLGLCKGRIIKKRRYLVDYEGFLWEVDVFEGDLAPLAIAEVELTRDVMYYPLPPFAGDNVTGNPRYYNSNL